MSSSRTSALPWALLVGVMLGWSAQSPLGEARAAPAGPGPGELHCRMFSVAVEDGARLETEDRTSEVGQWLEAERPRGWRVHTVDFEVAQKPSGFPMGFVAVCLTRG